MPKSAKPHTPCLLVVPTKLLSSFAYVASAPFSTCPACAVPCCAVCKVSKPSHRLSPSGSHQAVISTCLCSQTIGCLEHLGTRWKRGDCGAVTHVLLLDQCGVPGTRTISLSVSRSLCAVSAPLATCLLLCCAMCCRSGVTCCDSRSHSGNSLGSSNIEVGTCKFQQFVFSSPINEAPGVSKYGEFEVQW
jgi:hypothetical protein